MTKDFKKIDINLYLDTLEDKLILPIKRNYNVNIYDPMTKYIEVGRIEYKVRCENETGLLYLSFDFETPLEDKEPGEYNYISWLGTPTYTDTSVSDELDSSCDISLGVLNLDNEENINKSIEAIIEALKEYYFNPIKKDLSNIEFGKVVINSYYDFCIKGPIIKIYKDGNLIGKIGKDEIFTYKVEEDSLFHFEVNSFTNSIDLKIKKDFNNEIYLSYYNSLFSQLIGKVVYSTEDIDISQYDNYSEKLEYKKFRLRQLYFMYFRRVLYAILMFYSLFFIYGTISTILFWSSFIALIYSGLKYSSKWKPVGLRDGLTIDQGYIQQINKKLIPSLNAKLLEYGANIFPTIESDSPGMVKYDGYNREKVRFTLSFTNCHKDMTNKYHYRNPMMLLYSYKDISDKQIDEIDLSNNQNVNKTIELIINTLESNNIIKKF